MAQKGSVIHDPKLTAQLITLGNNMVRQIRENANEIIDECKRMTDESTGILIGGDGEKYIEDFKTISRAYKNLADSFANMVQQVDKTLAPMLKLSNGATDQVGDSAKKVQNDMGVMAKE